MSRGSDTRQFILNEALRFSSQFGLEGLTIGRLARTVGMSKSGLFAHFGSKEGLQQSVLDHAAVLYIGRVVRPALTEPRGEPRVRALFENWLNWTGCAVVPGGCVFVSTASEFDDRPGPVRDLLVKLVKELRQTLAGAARIAVEEGHFRADLDPEQFAFQVHALVLGFNVESRLFEDPSSRATVFRAFEGLVRQARARVAESAVRGIE